MDKYLEKCIVSLGNDVKVYDELESEEISDKIIENVGFDSNGVNWRICKDTKDLSDDLIESILDDYCYIMWADGTLPVIKSKVKTIFNNISNTTDVDIDTWIVAIDYSWVIEFHHSNILPKFITP